MRFTNQFDIDRDTLYRMYVTEKLTSADIARAFNRTPEQVRNSLRRYRIPIRVDSEEHIMLKRAKTIQEQKDKPRGDSELLKRLKEKIKNKNKN